MLQAQDGEESTLPSPPPTLPHNIQPTLTYVTKFNLNTKGEFKSCLNAVPVTMMADSGSARNLVSSETLALVLGEFYLNHLEKKSFRPIYDCNSKLLKILGAVQLKVSIEKLSIDAEFICYQGTNRTALLGFLTMHEENLVVYPRLGLFICSQPLDEQGDACFAAGDTDQEVVVESQEVLLPVAAKVRLSIPPGQCANVAAEVLLPALSPADKKMFSYSTFVFHSEKLQPYLPLGKIGCYYQYQCLHNNALVTLRYCNHTKENQIIYPGQIIAHAQEMSECTDDAIKACDDDILKYVFSIFKPDVRPGEPPSKPQPESSLDLGKPSLKNVGNIADKKTRNATVTPRVPNHETPENRASRSPRTETRAPNITPRVPNHATSKERAYAAASRGTRRTGANPKTNVASHPLRHPTPHQEDFNPAHNSHASRHQPSLITSNASTPYTYKTGLHELKGPGELEGSYKLSDIKIESNDPDERAFIYEMYEKHKDAVSQHEYDAGTYTGDKITFTLKKGTQTYHAKPYAIPSHLKPQADALVNQLVAAGIVGKMTAPAVHIAPLHFVQKAYADLPPHLARYPGEKDTSKPRKLRAVINHRVLNACVELPSRFPQATIPEILRKMHAATVAGTTDLRAAFYSLQMHPNVYPYMAFEYANELWFFKRCPMGFVMSSFALSAATQFMKIKYGLTQCEFMADDCLIWGVTADDYRAQVRKFFAALSATGFRLHPLKSTWWVRTNLPVLGFILNLECKSLLAAPQKIKSLMTTTQPRSKREIRRFIGAVSFLAHFIFGLQQLLRPLHTAASPSVPFTWTRECDFCWRTIRRSLACLPALKLPSPRYPLDLHTDGSPSTKRALNWLWCQNQGGKETYLVQFGSRCLAKEHLALSQPELEMLCLLSALQTDSHLVAYTSLRVHTDAKGLTYLATYENSQSKLRRWTLFLQSLPITLCFTRNTCSLIRLTDFLGRQREEVVKALKIKKPLAKDCVVFPTYNLEGISPLPFEHCWALLKEIIELQKLAQLDVGYPLMPDLRGQWRPLDGIIKYHSTTAPQQSSRLNFVPAAKCAIQGLPDPHKGDKWEERGFDLAALAQPPGGLAVPPQQKVDDWRGRHWTNGHLLPRPPDVSSSSAYNLTKPDRVRHHLPTIPHQSEFTNPTLNLQPGPILLHNYETHNLQQDERQPALRFLLVANAELRGLPLLAVKREQEKDAVCGPVMQQLKAGQAVKGFALFNGLLLCVARQPGLKLTLMLPQSLGAKYLAFLHESTALFHLQASTLTRLAGKYFTIKQMSKLALQITQDCLQCQLHNRQSHQAAVRGKRFTLSAPRQLLYADVCSFFTGKHNKSYFVICDGFSFLTSAYPLSSPETSDQLATHLLHYFSTHSTPSGVTLDHASVHENVLAQSLALLNIRKYQCSSRCPQPQLAERIHQYIIRILSLLSSSFKVKDAHLPCLVSFAIHVFNSTPLRSMGDRSPYSIHFGDVGNPTACVPTIHVGSSSSLPAYVKALAHLQASTWQAVNDIKRRKEKEHLQGGKIGRKPLYRPGDCVRMRTHILATAKNHKLAPAYSQHIYKVIKSLPRSGNYILLKLSDKNYLAHGFHSKQPLPKSCLTWAKESRLKRCNMRTGSPDTLAGKLFALFAEVAFKNHPVPVDFQLSPQVGKTIAVDPQFQKLSRFVLSKQAARPADRGRNIEYLTDSMFGKVPNPSGPSVQKSWSGEEIRQQQQENKGGPLHRTIRPARAIPFDEVVGKILPADLTRLHLAGGCKPPGELGAADDHDEDDGGDDEDPRAAAPRPVPHLARVGAGRSNNAPAPPAAPIPPAQHLALGARPKKPVLRKQGCPPPSAQRHIVVPTRHSPASPIPEVDDLFWDGTFDFLQPSGNAPSKKNDNADAGDDDGDDDDGDDGNDDKEEDERSFHSTRASPGASSVSKSSGTESSGSDEGEPKEKKKERLVPDLSLPPHPGCRTPLTIRRVTNAPGIQDIHGMDPDPPETQDIPGMSTAHMSLHGHQTFGNHGVRGKDVTLSLPKRTNTKVLSASKNTKTPSKGTRRSSRLKSGGPPPPAPPPPPPPPPPPGSGAMSCAPD